MSKRKTVGERIARKLWKDCAITRIDVEVWIWNEIDRAIRRAKAKAYDEGYGRAQHDADAGGWTTTNPYRGRPKL